MRKGAGLQSLTFVPGRVKGVTFSAGNPVLEFELLVQNTSNQSFTLFALAGNATSNGTYIGNISNFSAVTIAAKAQTAVTVTIRLQLIGIVMNIIEAIANRAFTQKINVEMTANIDKLQVPIKFNLTVGA